MPERLHKKHFTLEQARTILTGIMNLVEELAELKRELDKQGYDVYRHQYFGGSGPNGEKVFPTELERLAEITKQLDRKGILIKGFDEGLIDFPHIRSNGEEVYLCWKIGENDIYYWHSIPDGFSGRKPVEEL